MSTQQPEALRLADRLDLYATGDKHQKDIEQAADELRRLHEVNAELLEALSSLVDCISETRGKDATQSVFAARAARHRQGDERITQMTTSEEHLRSLVKKLFYYLEYQEENDSGTMLFNPIKLSCCRVMMVEPLNNLLAEMKAITLEDK